MKHSKTTQEWLKKNTFKEPKPRKQNPVTLGMRHAARVQATRTAKQAFGSGLLGQLAAVIARNLVNKAQ